MARHNGCPQCRPSFGVLGGNEGLEEARVVRNETRGGSPTSPSTVINPYYTGRPRTPVGGSKYTTMDRQEIIRRIKSRESRPTSPELGRTSSHSSLGKRKSPSPDRQEMQVAQLREKPPGLQQENEAAGLQIERPRSALHRGDFRDKEQSESAFQRFGDAGRDNSIPSLSTSPVAPWHPSFPSAAYRQALQPLPSSLEASPARTRAVSNVSLASSFTYKPPTSPLVQASRPDTPEPPGRRTSRSPDKSRRHTFSPHSFQRLRPGPDYPTSARQNQSVHVPSLRSEKTFPYQAHQPRRSLNSFSSVPHTPAAGSRRPSFSESPLHHASMVGSYEESILRGRMSTTPSRPLNFVAQIGVLGKGDCKPSLRCPSHAIVPFPAVFYSYGSGIRHGATADQPSPYVGLVDLASNLPVQKSPSDKRKRRLHAALSNEGSRASSRTRGENSASDTQARQRRRQKEHRRRSASPKAPPGGSYRIPQQGQLQIVIKNPNKTAVKLFLIPYDLSDMEPGQKTFIRQRSYSAGPIIDMPLHSRKNLGTDRPEASLNPTDDPQDRPMLRYLIHLHICCPSKGRYFLYKSVRVVFANRVPDGKEKLRNEIQLPEPRYSTYKPSRDSNTGVAAAPNASNRRQSAIDTTIQQAIDPGWSPSRQMLAQSLPSQEHSTQYRFPLHGHLVVNVNTLPTLESRPVSRQTDDPMDLGEEYASSRMGDPFIFERDSSRERRPGQRSESLLSRRLKDLAFQSQHNHTESGA